MDLKLNQENFKILTGDNVQDLGAGKIIIQNEKFVSLTSSKLKMNPVKRMKIKATF